MYNAEVLSKFPVIQHFPLGSLFSYARDPAAMSALPSLHIASHAPAAIPSVGSSQATGVVLSYSDGMVKAPWANGPDTSTASVNAVYTHRDTQRPSRNGPNVTPEMQKLPGRVPGIASHTRVTRSDAQESNISKRGLPNATPGNTTAPWAS